MNASDPTFILTVNLLTKHRGKVTVIVVVERVTGISFSRSCTREITQTTSPEDGASGRFPVCVDLLLCQRCYPLSGSLTGIEEEYEVKLYLLHTNRTKGLTIIRCTAVPGYSGSIGIEEPLPLCDTDSPVADISIVVSMQRAYLKLEERLIVVNNKNLRISIYNNRIS